RCAVESSPVIGADERLERYAELTVRVGANLQPGQPLSIIGLVDHAPLVRAVARAAYSHGASWVDSYYADAHVKRALIERGPEEALTWTAPWLLTRIRDLNERRGATVAITGDPEPELYADLDGGRVGRARPIQLAQ